MSAPQPRTVPPSATADRLLDVAAVLFDFDGTLTKPGALDFAVIREELGCPSGVLVLEWAQALPAPEREAALASLERLELEAAGRSVPNASAEEAVLDVRGLGLPVGILTRNGLAAVRRGLQQFPRLDLADFDVVITREAPASPKPSGDGIVLAAQELGVDPARVVMVGDYRLDVQAGHDAGAITVYLANGSAPTEDPPQADFTIASLAELPDIVRLGLPLSPGKVPNGLLAAHLSGLVLDDPTVLVAAGIGEDVAALDVTGDEVLVLHSDPITLASAALARYAVLVNANDIAASGAEPRWFLTTVLFPVGTTPSQVLSLLGALRDACAQEGISLVGGHTEVTDSVTRPVVVGTMAGTVARRDLVDKRRVITGDRVLLTKGVAVEGTALLAQEVEERLLALGATPEGLERARGFIDRMSVLTEARVARAFSGVSALHDVTEGGVATALEELSIACGHRLAIDLDRIPVFPETAELCGLLGIDPLGLISSGSLLVCCRPQEVPSLVRALGEAGVAAAKIGEVKELGAGVEGAREGRATEWPHFVVDEAARVLAS